MAGQLIRDVVASLPSATHYPGATVAQLTTDEELYFVKGGVWVNLRSGGTVTLAGDVIGASGSNTLVRITGSAGRVSVNAAELAWSASTSECTLSQDSPLSNLPVGNFTVRLAAPFASATGANRNAPTGTFDLPAPVAGGVAGRWAWNVSGAEKFAIEATDVLVSTNFLLFGINTTPTITQTATSGSSHTMTIASQSSTTARGANLSFVTGGGGGGNPAGDMTFTIGGTLAALALLANSPEPIVHFPGNLVRWSETSTPILSQEDRSSDLACSDMLFQSQAPFAGATTHKLPGNFNFVVPAPASGGDPPGSFNIFVSGNRILQVTQNISTWNSSLMFSNAQIALSQPLIFMEIAPANTNATDITFVGQLAGVGLGDTNGGDFIFQGGAAQNAGIHGGVHLRLGNANALVKLMQSDATHDALVLCGSALARSDLPTNMTNFIFVGDSAGVPNTFSGGGHIYASVGGRPFWYMPGDKLFMIDGSGGTPTGGIVEYMQVQYGLNTRFIALYAP